MSINIPLFLKKPTRCLNKDLNNCWEESLVGSWSLVGEQAGDGRQLWVGDFNPDAHQLENLRQVTDSPHHNHSAFNWRQNGTALLYLRSNQSVLTDPAEIWMVEFPSGIPVQVVIGGYSPQWIP